MRRRVELPRIFAIGLIPLLALIGIVLLLIGLRRAGEAMPESWRSAAVTVTAAPPSTTAVPSPAPPTASPPPTPTSSQLATPAPLLDAGILAIVNGVSISVAQFDEITAVDQAMATLTGQPASTPAQLLSQLINGELVVQTMVAAGIPGPTADDALGQFLTTTALPVLAVDQALGAVPRTRFADHLARLYGVNAFVRQQAALSAGTADEVVRTLQNAAQISYGPAAMSIFAPSSDPAPVAQSIPEAGLQTVAQPTPAPVPTEARGAQIGQLAPRFALPGLAPDGVQFTLDGLAGRPAVLSFWTTWCPYCRQQTPVLVEGYARYAQTGVQFVGIDVQEDEALVAAYRAEHQIPYPLALDRDGAVAGQYAVNGYPTTYFLDKDGRIRSTHVGALTPTQLDNYVEQVLDAKP